MITRIAIPPRIRYATALAHAAAPYVGVEAALELGNNLAVEEPERLTEQDVLTALRHRMRHFGLVCGDVQSAARDVVLAARRHAPIEPRPHHDHVTTEEHDRA